eukprot:scaffold143858_cov51-Attheya_sp.AAC.3
MAPTRKSHQRVPGPWLQSLNELVHTAPVSFVAYGIFWAFILIVASPAVGIVLLFVTVLRLCWYAVSGRHATIDTTDKQLAIVVTGCDTGFGFSLAFEMASKGYVVFAGCLNKESMKQYEGHSNIFPLKMDVTKEDEVKNAAVVVNKWINENTTAELTTTSPRLLHALVNNAGIGSGGLIDWLDISVFRKDMEGLVAAGFGSTYHGSKFAAEGFSICLRHEMDAFDIDVITVNPSFHETPLTDKMPQVCKDTWNNLDPKVREEYGEEFFAQAYRIAVDLPADVMWSAKNVVDALVRSLTLVSPPSEYQKRV